jgi:hypothetical protein
MYMLVSIFRNGPLRVQLLKGFTLDGVESSAVAAACERAQLPPAGTQPIRAVVDDRRPRVIWLDTGPMWQHTPSARDRSFAALGQATEWLADATRRLGGTLLPPGIRTEHGRPWREHVVGDRHLLEFGSETEREIAVNLFRQWTAAIIGLTGHAGVGPGAIGREGSRRLAESNDHVPTRYLDAGTRTHLGRLAAILERTEGLTRLSVMDIDPAPPVTMDAIEVRMIDGQALLATTRAHSLLLQAIMLMARRMEREGQRVAPGDRRILERNRALAISSGLDTRTRGSKGSEGPTVAAEAGRLLRIVSTEFPALKPRFDEVAPMVTGLALGGGAGAVRNEIEWWRRIAAIDGHDLPRQAADLVAHAATVGDPLTAHNRSVHASRVGFLEQSWAQTLRVEVPEQGPSAADALAGLPQRPSRQDVVEPLRAALADGTSTIDDVLRGLGRDKGRDIKTNIRRAAGKPVTLDALPQDWWGTPEGKQAANRARQTGLLVMKIDMAEMDDRDLDLATDQLIRASPAGLAAMRLHRARYKAKDTPRNVREIVIVSTGGGS